MNWKKKKTAIFFTDGSRNSQDKSTGAVMIQEGEEEGFYISIDKRCNIFAVDACAIAKAIHKWSIDVCDKERKENLIIFSDSLSVLKSLENNKINVYINPYVL